MMYEELFLGISNDMSRVFCICKSPQEVHDFMKKHYPNEKYFVDAQSNFKKESIQGNSNTF